MRSVAEGGPRERWDLLLREACKQSGNPLLPVIEAETKLPDALEKLQQENIKIYYGSVVPAEHGGGSAHAKAVVIGPEGGFAPEELEMMEKCNAEPLNLGPHVLRLETAAICALAVLRRLGIALMMCAMIFVAGCSCDSDSNPMLTKGQALLENGDTAGAHDYFLKAIAHNPEDPNAYLALAKLCDERIDEPLEAIYAYTMYLKVLPEGAEGRAEAEAALENLKERAVRSFGGGASASDAEVQALREENQDLRQTVNSLRQQVQNLLDRSNALTRQLQSRGRR
jgi:tetratricopeptide (TPR) repeat protein